MKPNINDPVFETRERTKTKHEMAAIFLSACLEQELLNSCFTLDKRYAAVGGKHMEVLDSVGKHTKNRSGLANSRGFYI